MAHEYGWTLGYIFSLTYRQLIYLVERIAARNREEEWFQGALHGSRVDPPRRSYKLEITKKEKDISILALNKILERKQRLIK